MHESDYLHANGQAGLIHHSVKLANPVMDTILLNTRPVGSQICVTR
jgi:hypothetical protein